MNSVNGVPTLVAQQITHRFNARGSVVTVLQDLTLSVHVGEIVTVVGPSGCGKTTILNILSGLLTPTQGHVEVDGNRIDGPTNKISYVTQQQTLLPWRTLQRNVEYLLELRRVPRPVRAERARSLIEQVGLGGFEKSYPHELSGGMRQRAMIIRALATDPEVLLLDEPFGALDAQTRGQLQNELLKLQAEGNRSILFVTHDLTEAVALGDRVIVLSARPALIQAEHQVPLGKDRDVFTIHEAPVFRDVYAAVASELLVTARPASGAPASSKPPTASQAALASRSRARGND